MKAERPNLLAIEHKCNVCGVTKPVAEMIVIFLRSQKYYNLRPRCKDCHNQHERGHRREWKKKYLQNWRKKNAKLNESYWKGNPVVREQSRIRAYRRFKEKHDAILIQGRMNRRGYGISLKEAEALLQKFGRCYPSHFGLTPAGLREYERIRSAMRRGNGKLRLKPVEIRMMVYEDGLFIKPKRQISPYQKSAKILRDWHQKQERNKEAIV